MDINVEFSDDNDWAMTAKAAGYPLCALCREPIENEYWGKSRLCLPCQARESDLAETERDKLFALKYRA